jgi:hypothetical protein
VNTPNCDDVADLIDLYAAHECDPAQERAVRAHLASCADCRATLDDSRRLMGLLDGHFGRDAALSRLGVRLKAEARPPRILSAPNLFVRRFAAVAALLLVTLGLGYLVSPLASSPRPAALQLAMVLPRSQLENVQSKPARGGHERDVVPDFPRGKKKLDLPPRIDVDLVVKNAGKTPIELDVGGPGFRCALDVRGPAVERHRIADPAYVPFPRRTLTIEPGGTKTLTLERLAAQTGERVQYLYPTAPGDYELRVRIETVARRQGVAEPVRLTAGPRTLRLP